MNHRKYSRMRRAQALRKWLKLMGRGVTREDADVIYRRAFNGVERR
jgi:hypothetical protein